MKILITVLFGVISFYLQAQQYHFATYSYADGLDPSRITQLWSDQQGRLCLQTQSGIVQKFNGYTFTTVGDSLSLKREFNLFKNAQGNHILILGEDSTEVALPEILPMEQIRAVCRDDKNGIWFGTYGQGLFKYDGRMFEHITVNNGLPSNWILSLELDKKGRLWVGTDGKGVCRLDSTNIKTFTIDQGLASNTITCIYSDEIGNMWFATDNGICKYTNEAIQFYNEQIGLSNNNVTAITGDRAGNIWLGTQNGLNHIYENKINSRQLVGDSIYQFIRSLLIKNDERLCVGSNLCDSLISHSKSFSKKDISYQVNAMAQDSSGNIWLGLDEGVAMDPIDEQKLKWFTDRNGFTDEKVTTIHWDSLQHSLWLGTAGDGLYCYLDSSFTKYTIKEGLPSDHIFTINSDKNGTLWIGSSVGLCLLSKDTIITLPQYAHQVNAILFDRQGNLWCARTNRIDQLAYKEDGNLKRIKSIGNSNELLFKTNANACYHDLDGCLWFGTNIGAIKIDPLQVIPNTNTPSIRLKKPMASTFEHDQNQIEFEFVGVELTNPDNVLYSWKLENYDSTWSVPSRKRIVQYHKLPPGDYQFKVKAANSDGVWNNNLAVHDFTINPPFWLTAWFKGVVIAIALFLIGWRWGYKQRKKRRKARYQKRTAIYQQSIKKLKNTAPTPTIEGIELRNMEGKHFVKLDNIVRCQGEGNYTHFHLADQQRIVVSKPLKSFEQQLAPPNFYRTHQSHIVNIQKVKQANSQKTKLILDNGDEVALSRLKKEGFLNLIEKINSN